VYLYLQGDNHLVSPCLYLDVRIKQKEQQRPAPETQTAVSFCLKCAFISCCSSASSSLTALTKLNLAGCDDVTSEGLRAVIK
jgi:hypothetical protein